MYLAVLDDKLKEIKSLGRRSLAEYTFKITASDDDEWDIVWINIDQITWSPLKEKFRTAAYLGHCRHADSEPFLILPLDNSRGIERGSTLAIGPAQLRMSMRNTKRMAVTKA